MPKRPFSPPTPEHLAKAALQYLGRYAASEVSLRRVLEKRIRRAALQNRDFADDKAAQESLRRSIEILIERHRKSGALNDKTYAETKINSLRRAGRSARAIRQKLGHAGVDKGVIDAVFAEGETGAEIKAALSLARRKKLGPFRSAPKDPGLYRKDLAALARAGFSLAIAKQVLGGQGLLDEDGAAEASGFFSAK